jgi:hypothetical protein
MQTRAKDRAITLALGTGGKAALQLMEAERPLSGAWSGKWFRSRGRWSVWVEGNDNDLKATTMISRFIR